jgi:dTDP-L-rhamnose 4-epimerase
MKKSPTVLVTGGLGFIGLHVAEELVRHGASVVLMDNLSPQIHGSVPRVNSSVLESDQVRVLRGDVRSRRDWLAALVDVDCVVHLAAETGTAQSMYEIDLYTTANIGGTALLLDILANQSHSVEKVIVASSRSVYGEGAYDCTHCGRVHPQMRTEANLKANVWDPKCSSCGSSLQCVPTPENANVNPASIYAATKYTQEELTRIAGAALGIATVAFRFQNVYGEGQSLKNPYTGILSIFSNRIRQSKPIYLFEDGQESRDFVHVTDVARAVVLSVLNDGANGKTLNVGSGAKTSVELIARTIKLLLGDHTEPVVSGQFRIGDIRHCYADLTNIRAALDFEPRIDLQCGLERFVEWVKTQPIEHDGLDAANQQLASRGLMARASVC